MINPDVKLLVEAELKTGEKLLWADKPRQFPLRRIGLLYIFTGIFWIVLLSAIIKPIFASLGADVETGVGSMFPSSSLIFFLVGGLVIFIPTKEAYALTDQRGLILWRFPYRRVASLSAELMLNSRHSGDEHIGTLNFDHLFWVSPMRLLFKKSFKKISNPKQVEGLIHRAFNL